MPPALTTVFSAPGVAVMPKTLGRGAPGGSLCIMPSSSAMALKPLASWHSSSIWVGVDEGGDGGGLSQEQGLVCGQQPVEHCPTAAAQLHTAAAILPTTPFRPSTHQQLELVEAGNLPLEHVQQRLRSHEDHCSCLQQAGPLFACQATAADVHPSKLSNLLACRKLDCSEVGRQQL